MNLKRLAAVTVAVAVLGSGWGGRTAQAQSADEIGKSISGLYLEVMQKVVAERLTRNKQAAPHFDWDAYLAAVGLKGVTAFDVATPKLIAAIDGLVTSVKPAAWRS